MEQIKKNIGSVDRIIRAAITIAMVVFFWTGHLKGYDGLAIRLIGVYMIITAFIRYDPIYSKLGINTGKKDQSDE